MHEELFPAEGLLAQHAGAGKRLQVARGGLSAGDVALVEVGDAAVGLLDSFMPSAIMPTTVATGMRRPRMQGTPPICCG